MIALARPLEIDYKVSQLELSTLTGLRCDELNLLAPWWSPLPVVYTGVMDNQES
jgi:hypothetical protein